VSLTLALLGGQPTLTILLLFHFIHKVVHFLGEVQPL
jgi:hypothetical protein